MPNFGVVIGPDRVQSTHRRHGRLPTAPGASHACDDGAEFLKRLDRIRAAIFGQLFDLRRKLRIFIDKSRQGVEEVRRRITPIIGKGGHAHRRRRTCFRLQLVEGQRQVQRVLIRGRAFDLQLIPPDKRILNGADGGFCLGLGRQQFGQWWIAAQRDRDPCLANGLRQGVVLRVNGRVILFWWQVCRRVLWQPIRVLLQHKGQPTGRHIAAIRGLAVSLMLKLIDLIVEVQVERALRLWIAGRDQEVQPVFLFVRGLHQRQSRRRQRIGQLVRVTLSGHLHRTIKLRGQVGVTTGFNRSVEVYNRLKLRQRREAVVIGQRAQQGLTPCFFGRCRIAGALGFIINIGDLVRDRARQGFLVAHKRIIKLVLDAGMIRDGGRHDRAKDGLDRVEEQFAPAVHVGCVKDAVCQVIAFVRPAGIAEILEVVHVARDQLTAERRWCKEDRLGLAVRIFDNLDLGAHALAPTLQPNAAAAKALAGDVAVLTGGNLDHADIVVERIIGRLELVSKGGQA
mmetsp:Transcript_22457/g.36296  ORF Transcript_22457/g.36296 Transcript_22457/m.36296 type:complete len:511 (-) Transcript_22457:6105-7637(-)